MEIIHYIAGGGEGGGEREGGEKGREHDLIKNKT